LKTAVYIQGRISSEPKTPYLSFNVTALALKDFRIGKLRMKTTSTPKRGYIMQGYTYFLLPKRHSNKYVMLDKDENLLGLIVKSGRHTGWWRYVSFEENM